MSANTNIMKIGELDFDQIKSNLKDFLRNQDQFKDYDFEGSSMSVLLDLLAYNTHYMAYYLNMVGNEMFLDSAILRNSIVSHAKNLNYVPTSRRSGTANVDIVVTPPDGNTTSTLVLQKYSEFQSEEIDGINYTFVTDTAYTASKNLSSNTFTFSGVTLKQGEHISYSVNVSNYNTGQRFIIPNENIDTSTLTVQIQTSAANTTNTVYNLAEDLTEITSNSEVYFLEEANNSQYGIYFGDNYLGKGISNNNIIRIEYIVTDGLNANKANIYTSGASVYGFSNIDVSTNSAAAGGAEKETNLEIKTRAPIAYTAQNRAVTVNDYMTILLKDYPNVEQVSVWGGEENDPIVYGKVFISLKPKPGFAITQREKDRIIQEIIETRNVLTVIPELIDPDYNYLKMQVTVRYDKNKTIYSPDEIADLVKDTITNYTDENLNTFNSSFRYSNLYHFIETSDPSVLDNDLKITLQKRIVPEFGVSRNYELNFATELHRGTLLDGLNTYPGINYLDLGNVERVVHIEEVPLSSTGLDSISVTNPGFDFIEPPTVTITGDGSGAEAKATIVNGKVLSIELTERGIGYSIATVTLTGGGGLGAEAKPVLLSKIGTLRMCYNKTNGEKVILNSDCGSINYITGKVNLRNFKPESLVVNPYYNTDTLTFNIEKSTSNDPALNLKKNKLLTLDEDDPTSILVTAKPI